MFDRNENLIKLGTVVEFYDPWDEKISLGKVIDYNFDAETVYLQRMPRRSKVPANIERSPISCRVLEDEEITMFWLKNSHG